MKAIIPVAGFGTRMLPASKSIPKEMITILDKPIIQYVIEEAYSAGIREVILVTHASKPAIENHFDVNFELEYQLEKKGKEDILSSVKSTCPPDLKISAVRQAKGYGLGHAILCAKEAANGKAVAVLLPDVLVNHYISKLDSTNLALMIRNFNQTGQGQVMVERVADKDVEKYGIADLSDANLKEGGRVRVSGFVEKPARKETPSNYAVVGRYVLPAEIWPILETTLPGAGGEIQLTDAIDTLLKNSPVDAFHISGKSHDCGNKEGYVSTFIEFALLDERFAQVSKRVLETIEL